MLSNLLERVKSAFKPVSEQERIDAYIAEKQPTNVCDVEYWLNEYDRRQHRARSSNFDYRV
jgi:hypothetical protein